METNEKLTAYEQRMLDYARRTTHALETLRSLALGWTVVIGLGLLITLALLRNG